MSVKLEKAFSKGGILELDLVNSGFNNVPQVCIGSDSNILLTFLGMLTVLEAELILSSLVTIFLSKLENGSGLVFWLLYFSDKCKVPADNSSPSLAVSTESVFDGKVLPPALILRRGKSMLLLAEAGLSPIPYECLHLKPNGVLIGQFQVSSISIIPYWI